MNFLAHLYLSGGDEELLFGNLIGDFVKGRIPDFYPVRIQDGLRLHRRIDVFAQRHVLFHRSIQRLSPHYRLYRGVLVDLFYDHFLAVEWGHLAAEPLGEFLARSRVTVDTFSRFLPAAMTRFVPVLLEELIPSYREVEGIAQALQRVSRRVRRPNPLWSGAEELVANYSGLRDDFHGFIPEVHAFVTGQLKLPMEEK